MILDDIEILNEVVCHSRNFSSILKDDNDPEVDRLYNASPPLRELVATYEIESLLNIQFSDEEDNVLEYYPMGDRPRGRSDAQRSDFSSKNSLTADEDSDDADHQEALEAYRASRYSITSNNDDADGEEDAVAKNSRDSTSANNNQVELDSNRQSQLKKEDGEFMTIDRRSLQEHDLLLEAQANAMENNDSTKIHNDSSNIVPGTGETSDISSDLKMTQAIKNQNKKNNDRRRSMLTSALQVDVKSKNINDGDANEFNDTNTIKLTIYLPDTSPIDVYLADTATFEDAIKKVLTVHKQKTSDSIRTPLQYDKPYMYDLCMHEGDGEPDKDFVFERSQNLNEHYDYSNSGGLNEYCLFKNESNINLYGRSGSIHSNPRNSQNEIDILSTKPPNTVLITIPSATKEGYLFFNFTDSTTMRDLLPQIAHRIRINLYTDHFSFLISKEDQKRMNLMSPVIGLDVKIASLSHMVRKFKLEKKAYQDQGNVNVDDSHARGARDRNKPRVVNNTDNNNNKKDVNNNDNNTNTVNNYGKKDMNNNNNNNNGNVDNNGNNADINQHPRDMLLSKHTDGLPLHSVDKRHDSGSAISRSTSTSINQKVEFTKYSAAAYQEWNVVKKNKYGMKQSRVLGIDGQNIYNHKRGEKRGNTTVEHAVRSIMTIIRNTVSGSDTKVLRITFNDKTHGIHDIEYVCETKEECAEINSKLNYLRGLGRSRKK